jgi:rubrerythrin
MLSYLEYIGSRKIFKTQEQGVLNEAILRHASDEARHALILKTMIERLTPGENSGYDPKELLCGYSAYRYFQSLDSIVKKTLQNRKAEFKNFAYACYVYVSHIIEIRANWMYAIYAECLDEKKSTVSVTAIINDEKNHLSDTELIIKNLDPRHGEYIYELDQKEKIIFLKFFNNIYNF